MDTRLANNPLAFAQSIEDHSQFEYHLSFGLVF